MNSTTVAVDLAKSVFELAVAGADGRVCERHRLNRVRFAAFFVHRSRCLVVMEACGSAHYWGREITALGHETRLIRGSCPCARLSIKRISCVIGCASNWSDSARRC